MASWIYSEVYPQFWPYSNVLPIPRFPDLGFKMLGFTEITDNWEAIPGDSNRAITDCRLGNSTGKPCCTQKFHPSVINNRSSMLVGLEQWLANYGQPLTVKSGYRSPYVQSQIKPEFPQDRHIHGDAVDVASSSTTWPTIRAAAWSAQACVEPFRIQKNYGHVHGQWNKPCPRPDWAQGGQ